MPIDEHLAFDTTSVELDLHWLTLRYGIEVRLLIADLRSRYGDQKGDRIRLSRYISSDAQAIDTLRHEHADAVTELEHRSKTGHTALLAGSGSPINALLVGAQHANRPHANRRLLSSWTIPSQHPHPTLRPPTPTAEPLPASRSS